jgi:hypothetical protein
MDRTMSLQFNRVIRQATNRVRDQARGKAPSATGAMRRGILVRKGRATRSDTGWRIMSLTPHGAIFELAAEGHSKQGRSLVSTLTARYGAPGRFVWDAWDAQASATYRAIAQGVRDAEAQIQARLGGKAG